MPTTKFYVTKDARIARRESDNWDSGSGTSDGLPYGLYSGYRYRVLLGFSINMSGWTAISSAYLNYKSSSQIHVGFGSDPTFKVQRLTGSWSEGSSSGLSASNAVIYPGPTATSANEVIEDAPTTESTWGSVNITAMMQAVLAGGAFTGLRLLGTDNAGVESDSSANVGEIFSREQGSDAYIEITYSTNTAPTTALAIAGLSGGFLLAAPTNLAVTPHDAENDLINQIETQISTDSTFATGLIHNVVTPMANVADDVAYNIPVTGAYTPGVPYYARARSRDDNNAVGGWVVVPFKIAQVPVLTVTEPSAAGRLGKLVFTPGQTPAWTTPRLQVDWTFSCPDGGTQSSATVEVWSDAAGSPGAKVYDSGPLLDPAVRSVIADLNLTEGAYYHVVVSVSCSHGKNTTMTGRRVRVRWGVVVHRHDMGGPPATITLTTLDVTDSVSGGGSGRVVIEYATTTLSGDTPSWQPNLGAAGRRQWFWYRAWLLVWGATPAVSPSLNQLKITYDSTILIPDLWVRQDAGNEFGDTASFVYGTKSLKMQGTGAVHRATQLIPVVPRTDYILSGRIASSGDSGAYIALAEDASTSAPLVQSDPVTGDIEFDDPRSGVKTGVWNSGDNNEVYVRCVVTGAAATAAWFDALKLEASTVVSPWQPGFIAPAVVLDSGGVQIDAKQGGIFRLKGSTGGARDFVSVGARGLLFGGDVEVYSPAANQMALGDTTAIRAKPPRVVTYTSGASGTYVPPADLLYAIVEVQGGGGAGGGIPATAAGAGAQAPGGAGGGYARKLLTGDQLRAAAVTYQVGAGGAGASNAAGGAGGQSFFRSAGAVGFANIDGNGGEGGSAAVADTGIQRTAGADGGSATGGDINIAGGDSTGGTIINGAYVYGSISGSSALGTGARAASNSAGSAGGGYGSGGGGATNTASQAARAGAGGQPGIIIITEFYGP